MPRAELTITLPDGTWITDLSKRYPDCEFRVLGALPDDETGVGLVEICGVDLPDVIREAGSREGIISLDILQSYENRALVQFETNQPLLLFSARESGIPLEPPIVIRDGDASVEVTASQDRLSMLGAQLEAFGMSFDVVSIHQSVDTADLLTDRQRRVVMAAIENGYYDTPRTSTLTELAGHLGIAKSTASETLHRAEEKMIKQFVDDASVEPFDVGATR